MARITKAQAARNAAMRELKAVQADMVALMALNYQGRTTGHDDAAKAGLDGMEALKVREVELRAIAYS